MPHYSRDLSRSPARVIFSFVIDPYFLSRGSSRDLAIVALRESPKIEDGTRDLEVYLK